MLKPRVGCYGVFEKTEEGWENAGQELKDICEDLRKAGMDAVEAPESVNDEASCERVAIWFKDRGLDLLHPVIITWSFDLFTLMMHRINALPIAVRTVPGIRKGSVVGGQQLGCLLGELGIEHRLFYGAIGSPKTAKETAVYARACALKKRIYGTKIAMLGRRTPGMTAIAFDELEITRLFGIRIHTIGMDEFQRIAKKINTDAVKKEWSRIASKASEIRSLNENGLVSVRNYLALKKLAEEQSFRAMAIGSYPDCQGTMCLATALLNDEGIAAGCEGDMNSTIAMYILGMLSNDPVHFGEMLEIDEGENTVISSHCGAGAVSLASNEGHVLCPVRLANTGVCVRYGSKAGPVTYVNLSGRKDTYRMCGLKGEALPTGMVFEGNPMKIKFDMPFNHIWRHLSDWGFGHHWMALYGHVTEELGEFCRITGIKGFFPDLMDRG